MKLSSPKSDFLHLVISKGVDVCFVGVFSLLAVYLWCTVCELQLVTLVIHRVRHVVPECIFLAFGDFNVPLCKARQRFTKEF